MRILIVSSTENSMAQRIASELAAMGHETAFALHGRMASRLPETAAAFRPDLIVGAALTRALPDEVAQEHFCVLVEPVMRSDGETCDVTLREAAPQLMTRPILAMRSLPPLRAIPGRYREALAGQAVACLCDVIALLPQPAPARMTDQCAAL